MFTYISTVFLFIFEKRLGGNVSDYQQQLSLNIVAGGKDMRAAGIHTFSVCLWDNVDSQHTCSYSM